MKHHRSRLGCCSDSLRCLFVILGASVNVCDLKIIYNGSFPQKKASRTVLNYMKAFKSWFLGELWCLFSACEGFVESGCVCRRNCASEGWNRRAWLRPFHCLSFEWKESETERETRWVVTPPTRLAEGNFAARLKDAGRFSGRNLLDHLLGRC